MAQLVPPRGCATFPPPMLSIPASPHFVGQSLRVKVQEFRHFGAMLSEENQFASLPVLPSRSIDAEPNCRLADGRAALATFLKQPLTNCCWLREGVVPEEAEDRRH